MRRAPLFLLITVLAVSTSPAGNAQSDDDAKFTPLFDGKTLQGWQGEADRWRVENGAIVGEIPAGQRLDHNTWLVWEGGKLDDFELRLEFRLSGKPAANSGVQFRCQAESANRVSGYQADLDMGATWLGRIYDEHGRALLVERGTRVLIQEDGERVVETFALADRYEVLFRENDWNDYRIRACDEHMTVEVNGTLFSELVDKQQGERDLSGQLAFQLHSGPETRIEFRNIRVRKLATGEHRVRFKAPANKPAVEDMGILPVGQDGKPLNVGFEDGTLKDWTASGTAFDGQPVSQDGIAARWRGQASRKAGQFFIGGFEIGGDAPVGQLESVPFEVTQPYASFLIGGGVRASTRVEINLADAPETVIQSAGGGDREEMKRVVVDLKDYLGKEIRVRLIDENPGAWGHINFDDFRFHNTEPIHLAQAMSSPLQENPLFSRLVRNPPASAAGDAAAETVAKMHLPAGFTAELIAAEPQLFQPIAFTFDARGRIWVVEGLSYPQKRPDGAGLDRILIFSDEDGDGRFESRKVFIEGLNLASGLEVGYGGVWVGAAPELLFIPDRDQDDQPDAAPRILLTGFGYQDTHETLNSFVWGPDGWLYGNQGVFNYSRIGKPGSSDEELVELRAGVWRYHPVRHQFEAFAHGGSNQWGLDFDQFGQLFMTHCRSRWGRGPTTHVIQGGRYWNQANRNYADFVSATAPAGYPFLRNYMLASARYGHGEGGAGKPGSRAVYGGHSHVGTMIYLGDNWPDTYRHRLFTHNLHGHQINQQENRRVGSGFNTVHAGHDVFFCEDVRHIGVDLKYGPDGAVYTIDWYDERLCHNPNIEQWDRTNGRIYRLAFAESYKPIRLDLAKLPDDALIELLEHKNDWFARTALRLLQERAADGELTNTVRGTLFEFARTHPDAARRLRAVWGLYAAGGLDDRAAQQLLQDANEYVRAWTIQLVTDDRQVSGPLESQFVELAHEDPSAVVRLYLASAMDRLTAETAWQIARALSQHAADAQDRNLPAMIWFGLARLVPADVERAFQLAGDSQIPVLSNYVRWYIAKRQGDGLDRIVQMIRSSAGRQRQDLLEETALALAGQHGIAMPGDWSTIAEDLYRDDSPRIRRLAENLGAVFGDESMHPRKRRILADRRAHLEERRHAFRILARAADADSLPVFLALLDDNAFRSDTLLTLAGYAEPEVGAALIDRFASFSEADRASALNSLTGREAWAQALLDAVADGRIDKTHLSAYYVRQLSSLNSKAIDELLAQQWGKVEQSSEEKLAEMSKLERSYSGAPLWAYSAASGREHFRKLCSSCHRANNEGTDIGPKLAGSGSKGVRYFLENVVDPNAVIGTDFQTSIVYTIDGRVVSGLVQQSTETAITLVTPTVPPKEVVIPHADIDEMVKSGQSLMPERILETLNEREILELFKYLSSL